MIVPDCPETMLAEPLPLLAVIVVDDFFRGLRGGQVGRDHANQHLRTQFIGLDLLRGHFPTAPKYASANRALSV